MKAAVPEIPDRIDSMNALVFGYERIVAWADLLDQLNVFPVHDCDTGRNLKISLAPFKKINADFRDSATLIEELKNTARGNSGNIAAAFFSGFMAFSLPDSLPEAAEKGCELAGQAVADPKSGTMLDLFDNLARFYDQEASMILEQDVDNLTNRLRESVENSVTLLPALREAGVVDSGALGMFLFLEGFFKALAGRPGQCIPVIETFKSVLKVSPDYSGPGRSDFCMEFLVQVHDLDKGDRQVLTDLGSSVVMGQTARGLKVHLHTHNRDAVHQRIAAMGPILECRDEPMDVRPVFRAGSLNRDVIHIMTDAAGSITADRAAKLGLTLLDSYIVENNQAGPETLVDASRIYASMAAGERITTSQASIFQRHESFRKALEQYDRVLYLCVGSIYTGNWAVARQWVKDNGMEHRMTVLDTGAASGRLGLIAEALSFNAESLTDMKALITHSHSVMEACDEYLFLNQLKYLAMGGRMSKAGSLIGDLLSIRPVISPRAGGAIKVATVRSREGQIRFAGKQLKTRFSSSSSPRIMLEYSDNREWVASLAATLVRDICPRAEISIVPLSLTSGVHMGPGTWGMAFLPREFIKSKIATG